jgi:hypothetical protein
VVLRCLEVAPDLRVAFVSHVVPHLSTNMSLEGKVEGNDNAAEISSTQSQPQNIEEAGSKAAFLATFTPQDDKDVMRKVDRRFLLLIGILYMTKNVSASNPLLPRHWLTPR